MITLDEYIRNLDDTIKLQNSLFADEEISVPVRIGLMERVKEKTQPLEWLTDYKRLKEQQAGVLDQIAEEQKTLLDTTKAWSHRQKARIRNDNIKRIL